MTDILKRALPKWPQMRVSGMPVKPEQALEIIRRTDDFFHCATGNDDEFVDYWVWRFGIPVYPMNHDGTEEERRVRWRKYDAVAEAWQTAWGVVQNIRYVRNDWISSCCSSGPSGWCWVDGTISHQYNVGKWPSGEELQEDWQRLAKAFPFLHLGVDLQSAESCETSLPVIGFLVKEGKVEIVDPQTTNPLDGFPELKPQMTDAEEEALWALPLEVSEHGIRDEVLEKWANRRVSEDGS